ncbi:MAG TPA: putative sulfate exporter family transporter [Steroidobacteraceae bacterium]|nr:putative sulfate exporter family transporter [Steroidobacteraceae bacterium]
MIAIARGLAPGLMIVAAISALAFALARVPALAAFGLSALTIAILIGAFLGNLGHRQLASPSAQPGLQFAQKTLLRLGVAFYGLNLSLQQIVQVGPAAVAADLFIVTSTIVVGWWIGFRWLKMDRDTVLLASAGSGICGAAAVIATESVLGAAAHKTSAAVGQVVLFGSLAMLIYPLLFGLLGAERAAFGVYVGSTVHEVAQVVAIGKTIGGATAENAVIVKMIRVMMLAPFLIVLGRFAGRRCVAGAAPGATPPTRLPGFAIAFIVIAIAHPYLGLSPGVLTVLRSIDVVLLAAAMAALGLDTTIAKLRIAGRDVLVLGAILFAYLVVGGGIANWLIERAFG